MSKVKKVNKILVTSGIGVTGVTTVTTALISGIIVQKNPTICYERHHWNVDDTDFTLFDLGNQIQFLDLFVGDLSKSIFSKVTSMVFLYNLNAILHHSFQSKYFRLQCECLHQYSPQASVIVFLHQTDQIPPTEVKETCDRVEKKLREEIQDLPFRKLEFYPTSISSPTLFLGVTACFQDWLDQCESLNISVKRFQELTWQKNMSSLWEKPLPGTPTSKWPLDEWQGVLNAGIDDNWYNYRLKDLIRQFQTIFQWVYHSYIHLAGGSFKQTINDYCIGLSGKKLTHSKWEEIIITSNNPDIDFSVTLNALLLNGTLFLDLRTLVQSGKTNVLRPSLPHEIVSVTRVMLPPPRNEWFRLDIIDERYMESIFEPSHL